MRFLRFLADFFRLWPFCVAIIYLTLLLPAWFLALTLYVCTSIHISLWCIHSLEQSLFWPHGKNNVRIHTRKKQRKTWTFLESMNMGGSYIKSTPYTRSLNWKKISKKGKWLLTKLPIPSVLTLASDKAVL